MTIYIRMKEIAEQQHLTVRELAQLAGLSPSTVYRLWRNPYARTDTRVLDKLAKALQVDASELIRSEREQGSGAPWRS